MHRIPIAPRRGILAVASIACLLGPAATADDTALFTAAVSPNVLLVVDNSGSMNNLVWHPEFDPTVDPSCNYYSNDVTYSFSGNLTLTRCGNTRTLYADTLINNRTRIDGRYLNWYFSDESDSYVSDLYSLTNGTTSQCLVDQGEPATYSKYRRSRVTAARRVLRRVICQVNAAGDVRFGLAQFYRDGEEGYINSDPLGGYVNVEIADYDQTHADDLDLGIDELEGESWTPLAETLYNVYRYFQSRNDPAVGKDDVTEFPVYDIALDGDVDASNAPPSPVQYACQKNFVIVITDGEPTRDDFDDMNRTRFRDQLIGDYNTDNDSPEVNDSETDQTGCVYCDETNFYLDDIAKFMQENDFRPDLDGTQLIDTYTVGFTTSPAANALLEKTADVGNGLFFHSNNAEELAQHIATAITDIIEKSQSFTAATVPAARTTDGNNFYFTYFLPRDDSPFWDGHLKNFEFSAAGDILTGTGTCATGTDVTATPPCDPNGVLRVNADPFWDASEEVPAPGSRNLFFGRTDATSFVEPPAWTTAAVTPADLNLTAADLSVTPFDQAADVDELTTFLVKTLRGCEFGTDCTVRTTEEGDPSLLGDIFHSNPVVVGSPNAPVAEASYQTFASTHRSRDRVIYAGSNDGFLHAFHAGDWQTTEADGVTPLVPPRHDRGTGEELFGFMPTYVRERIKELLLEGYPRSFYAVDGSPIVADAWLYRDFSSPGSPTDKFLTKADKVPEQWRTILLAGLRQGGERYLALDISDPDGAEYPGYLWEFPCEVGACAGALNNGTETEIPFMAETWSEPVVTRVRVAVNGGTQPYYERWVAIFGAGYSEYADPNHASYETDTTSPNVLKGRAIYMVDITTGKVLAKKHWAQIATSTGVPQMEYGFASAPAVFDLDFDGFADVIYIGDLGGRLWKWVVRDVGDDPVNNSVSNADPGQPDWDFQLFFQAPQPATLPLLAGDQAKSIFFPPTGVLRQGTLVLAFGTGERADPARWDEDGDPDNNNRFYVVKDEDPLHLGTPPDPVTGYLSEADLADNAALDSYTCSDLNTSYKGYYIVGEDAEKFVTNSIVFLGDVFTGSFIPQDPDSADVCTASGFAYLYRFDIDCGVGRYPDNPGSGNDDRRKKIGVGVPTRPRISVGDFHNPPTPPDCTNKVVMITSNGSVENDCPGTPSTTGVNIRSWRER